MASSRRKKLQKGSSPKNIRRFSSLYPLSKIILTIFLLLILVSITFFAGKLSGIPEWKFLIIAITSDSEKAANETLLVTGTLPDSVRPTLGPPPNETANISVQLTLPLPVSQQLPGQLPQQPEPIITTYTQVELLLNNVGYEWLDSHGRILELDYTISNNEAGTILPHHFVLQVEGYTDIQKKIVLAKNSQRLLAHQKLSTKLLLPSPGFTYAEPVAGVLENVRITLSLYDGADVLMDTFVKEFDLRGKNMTTTT